MPTPILECLSRDWVPLLNSDPCWSAPWEATMIAYSAVSLPHTWETQVEFKTLDLSLPHSWLLWAFEKWISWWEILPLPFSLYRRPAPANSRACKGCVEQRGDKKEGHCWEFTNNWAEEVRALTWPQVGGKAQRVKAACWHETAGGWRCRPDISVGRRFSAGENSFSTLLSEEGSSDGCLTKV